eukprot:403346715
MTSRAHEQFQQNDLSQNGGDYSRSSLINQQTSATAGGLGSKPSLGYASTSYDLKSRYKQLVSQQKVNTSRQQERTPRGSDFSKFFSQQSSKNNQSQTRILHEQKFPAAGRLNRGNSPMGAKNSYWYNSPQIKPNDSFNFWHDIKANVIARNTWEDNNLNDGKTQHSISGTLKQSQSQKGLNTFGKRSSQTPNVETQSIMSGRASTASNMPVASKYAARLLYSQVDLGSDDDDARSSRGASSARNSLQRSRQNSSSRIVYQQGNPSQMNNFAQGKLNTSSTSLLRDAQKNGVDVNTQRKVDSKNKWFTSQISELPGPKSEVKHNLQQQYKNENLQASKLQNEKNQLKSRILYGSYYQDSKYAENYKPSRAYRTYVKEVKSEWSRNPKNENSVIQRESQLYKKTILY